MANTKRVLLDRKDSGNYQFAYFKNVAQGHSKNLFSVTFPPNIVLQNKMADTKDTYVKRQSWENYLFIPFQHQ
jgi:hypothetical protein